MAFLVKIPIFMVHLWFAVSKYGDEIEQIGVGTNERLGGALNSACFAAGSVASESTLGSDKVFRMEMKLMRIWKKLW